MGKGERLRMQEETALPEGTYKLTRTQVGMCSNINAARNKLAEMKAHYEQVEMRLKVDIELDYDALCAEHGIDRFGREVIVSSDLTTFILGESNGQESGIEKQSERSQAVARLVNHNGVPLGVQPNGISAERAGEILALAEH